MCRIRSRCRNLWPSPGPTRCLCSLLLLAHEVGLDNWTFQTWMSNSMTRPQPPSGPGPLYGVRIEVTCQDPDGVIVPEAPMSPVNSDSTPDISVNPSVIRSSGSGGSAHTCRWQAITYSSDFRYEAPGIAANSPL